MTKEGTVLNLYFKDAGDEPVALKFPYADLDATEAEVRILADACVENGTLWDIVPVEKVKAEIVDTTVIDLDITD